MSSPSLDPELETRSRAGALASLLDPTFGYFVWAAHLLAVYVATAVGCVLGLDAASVAIRTAFRTALTLVTIAAIAVVVLHAVGRYRDQRLQLRLRFRMSVTIGSDAIATVAIAWQLLAILLVPACA